LVILAAALFVRMCFDLAQSELVRDNDRRVLGVLSRSVRLAFHSGRLFAGYIGIGSFAAATFGIGTGIWMYLPHSATVASFVVLELVVLTQIASRLWLKAASARWISLLSREAEFTLAPLDEASVPIIEATDVRTPLPE
jgi:hypothetical protein